MKKFLLLMAVLLAVSLTAGAVDFSGMTVDELYELHINVMKEIKDRSGITSINVPAGTYEAGVDFPAGSYSVENLTNDEYSFAYVLIYRTKKAWQVMTKQITVEDLEYIKYGGSLSQEFLDFGEVVTIKTDPGTIVIFGGGNFLMTPHAGLTINTK